MAWVCMAANSHTSNHFTDDLTDNRSSRMNFEVARALSAQIQ